MSNLKPENTSKLATASASTDAASSQSAASPFPRGRILGLDGARGLLGLLVVVRHFFDILPVPEPLQYLIGHWHVPAFLYLSGVVLFIPIVRRNMVSPNSLVETVRRRSQRLWIPFMVSIVLSLIWNCTMPDDVVTTRFAHLPPHLMACSVVLHILMLESLYVPIAFSLNGAYWMLSYELIISSLLPLYTRIIRRFGWIIPLVLAFAGALLFHLPSVRQLYFGQIPLPASAHIKALNHEHIDTDFFLLDRLLTFFYYFLCGAITVYLIEKYHNTLGRLYRSPVWSNVLLLGSAMGLIGFPILAPVEETHLMANAGVRIIGAVNIALPLLCASVLATILFRPESLLSRFLRSRAMTFAGRISFSMFLTHMIVRDALCYAVQRFGIQSAPGMLTVVAAGVALAVGIATLFYYAIDRYFQTAESRKEFFARLRSRWLRSAPLPL